MGRLAGKTALVTGAATGIGRACVVALAKEGAAVIAADIDMDGVAETCRIASADGGKTTAIHLDVASEADWESAMDVVRQTHPALTVLVNNAGICAISPLVETSLELWKRTLAVNLDGTFLGTRAVLPLMTRNGGGSIINVSSTAGLVGSLNLSAYCASKGGVRLFTKSVALECATLRNGIRVNSVHPGGVETPIWGKMAHDGALPADGPDAAEIAQMRERALAHNPMGMFGQPEDIAAGVVYLASDESRFVTGTELVIDGGATAR